MLVAIFLLLAFLAVCAFIRLKQGWRAIWLLEQQSNLLTDIRAKTREIAFDSSELRQWKEQEKKQ